MVWQLIPLALDRASHICKRRDLEGAIHEWDMNERMLSSKPLTQVNVWAAFLLLASLLPRILLRERYGQYLNKVYITFNRNTSVSLRSVQCAVFLPLWALLFAMWFHSRWQLWTRCWVLSGDSSRESFDRHVHARYYQRNHSRIRIDAVHENLSIQVTGI